MSNAESEFQSAIAAAGLTPPDTIEPGRIHRFPGAGKGRGNTAGRCFMFPDMRGGWYEDYSSGSGQVNWQASGSKPYSQAERQANIERSKAANEAYKAEKEQAQAAAA
jgi:putative DNA primase/helicase